MAVQLTLQYIINLLCFESNLYFYVIFYPNYHIYYPNAYKFDEKLQYV